MNTGLDPELLTMGGDFIVPAATFLDPPTRGVNGTLNPLSYDNAAVEMRPTHSTSLTSLVANTGLLLRKATLKMRLARMQERIPPDSYLSLIPAGELHPDARKLKSVNTFGCSPSLIVGDRYHAYIKANNYPARSGPMRSAGFHIHQELTYPNTSQMVVPILDGLLGLMDVIINHRMGWAAADKLRRSILGYGRAGEYRTRFSLKGRTILEYRTLSPWPLSTPKNTLWVVSVMQEVSKESRKSLLAVLEDFPKRLKITDAINSSNHKAALTLWTACNQVWEDKHAKRERHQLVPHISAIINVGDSGLRRLNSSWQKVRAQEKALTNL